jgi:Pyruvate/2-oxoacid:ferredoxin oxidoreductase delta subunit
MCQFCHQHGEGKKWYLKAEHYSEELLDNVGRRQYIKDFVGEVGNSPVSGMKEKLQRAARTPAWLRHLLFSVHERRFRRDHFGQIVPIEDLKRIMALANSIVRLPCICRKSTTGRTDARYCFGLGMDSEKLLGIREAFLETFRFGPDTEVFEKLTGEEAMALHHSFEKEGLTHSIWTFKTPFIGAICNCDRSDCLAMVSYQYDLKLFFRSEYLAFVDTEKCVGCRACMLKCQFGAIGFSTVNRKTFIDPIRCFGCGICRSGCETGAIHLMPRVEHPIARKLW